MQSLLNIITNTAHAIASKNEQSNTDALGTITISTIEREKHIEVRMPDDGEGIPDQCLDRIFEPIFTTREVGHGTGQGLSISYDIVKNKHCGDLTVETEEGVGNTFTLSFPKTIS